MSQLRRGAILLSVLYILLLTSGFACTEPVWSTPCIWPGTVTQPNPVDINHMNPEELSEYETILNTIKLIHVACFNEEVYEIIHNIKTDDARDLIVAFYVYKDHDFHYVGSFGANRKIFKTEIINHNHYFVRNFYHLYIGNGRSWIIDKLIMIPHVKADIIQFCDDINCKCEIDDFDDISTETRMNVDGTGINVSNVGFKSKDKAVCEALIANKGISANNADGLIKVKENSSSSKINQICSENKLFKLPCICNNPNTYTDPCVNRFLKPCAYPSLKNYQNVCPCTKLSNLLELKPCKFISNLCPFLCKNPVPSLSIDKPRFKPITEQICPLNSLQKVCPSPQFSKWYNPYLYYATHDTKPNTNGNLYLREDSTNTEKSNELYNNAKININQMDGNDKKYPTNKILSDQDASINADKKIVGNTTPNGEATATCYAQSNVKDSKFAVLSSQTQSLDSNENNEVICTGQLKPTNNQNPFRISIENGVDKLQLGSNTLLENGQKLNEQQEFPINVNQTPLPKIGANSLLTKLLVDKIPKRLDSSVTNVYPRNKLTYLQSPDLTTINEIQKIPIDETNTNIFITNNNSNIGTAMADINKQASEFSQPNYNREIFEDIGTRFTNKKPEPLAKQSPEIVPTVMKNEIKYSDNVMLNIAPNSHRDTKLDEELPKSISERKYEKTPIGSNMNLFPEPIEILTLPNNKQNLYSPGTSVAQGYNTNDHRIQIDNPHNIYAVNNNQIQSTQNKTPIFSFSLPKEQIAVHPLTSYQSKLHVPAPNTDMGVQLNNDYMNPKATTTFAKLSDYEIPNNGERIQLNNAQNVYATNNDKLQTKLNNAPSEVLSSSLPNKQIVVNAPICYQLKPSVATLNKDKGVLQLYNGNINPKATIFAKLPQYKILNNEIDENENLNIQSTAPLTGGVFLTPNHIKDNNDQIQLNNPRNVFAINNKIQSTQNNIPNEILSFPLPTEQVRNNPLTYHESKLKLQKPSSDMKVLQLHNQYTNPLATITFKIPNNQIDEKDNPNAQSIDTLTGNSLVTPDYKTDNNYRIQLNNPQNIYAGNDNKIQNTQTYLPNEVYSYFLPKKQISVNPPIRYESKLNLPIPSTAMGALQFNNDYMNPKAPTTFAKLQGYEIPNNEIGEKDKTNVQSTPDTLTGGLFVTPDYKTDNNYRIRFNNPQNVNAVNDKKIQSTQNNIPNELLSYPLPNKQIAVKATISYQPQLNVHIPNTDEGVLQLSNEDMNPIAITTFTKLLDYEILNNQIDKNEKSTEQDVSALTGSVLTTPDYKTTNGDRIELSNPQNIYTVNNNKIQSTQNNIPNGFLSYSLPEDQFPANQLISHNSKLNPLSPYINTKVLELNNKNMYPKASITYTKLPELELSNKKINKNLNSIAQSIDTFTGGNNPQNVYAVNNIKIQSVQNNKPNEVFSYSLPNEQTAVNPLNYESKSNLLTPNINVKVLPSKNEHLNLKAITTSEISNNQIVEKENPNVQSTNTISSNVPGTPCYKTNNDNNIQLNNPRNVYAVDNNNIQSTPNEVFSYVLPEEQNIVNSPIIYQSKLNFPAPNINMGVLQSNNDDMNPKATVMFTKLQENKITNNQIYENENQIVQGFQILTGHVQAKPDYKTNNGDKTEISIPQNICTINDEKTQSAQNNIPNEVLSYSLPEEKNLVNPSFNYNSNLNLPTPHTNLKILQLRTNPKSSRRFTELPEYNIEIDENVNSIAQDIDTCTGRLLLTPGSKTELNNPHNVYAAYNNIQSVQNNKPDEVSSYSLPNEQLVGNPLIYEPKLNLPTPNTEKGVVQLNDGDMNPKTPITFAKLPKYEITNNQIGEKENPNLQSIDNLTGDGLISPGFTTGDSDNIQLNNPKNVFAIYNNNIPNTPNNVPYAVCPLFLKKEKITMNPSINYESKLNQPTSIILQPNNDHINPKARTIFAKLPKYEIPYENKNTIAQEIKTVTGGVLVTPDFKTNYDDIKQLNYPQNIYAVNNNKIQSIQPCNVLPYFLPKENNAVNSLISYQSKLNLPIPNILKLNNKSFNTNTNEPSVVNPFSYESKYEIPYSEIDENGKPNAQSMDNLTDGFLVMPDYKTVNNDRIQLYHPQNICTIDNDKIQNTQNNKPNEILSYSSPNEQVVGDSSNHYQSKKILPTSDTNMKILHLNNDYINPKATTSFAKLPDYELLNKGDRILLNHPKNVYVINNNIQSTENSTPTEFWSNSLSNEQIAVEAPINYQQQLNVSTPNTGNGVLQLSDEDINPRSTITFSKLPDYKRPNNGYRIQHDNPQNVYAINNNKMQSAQNNIPEEFLSYSLPNEEIVGIPQNRYQSKLNVQTQNTGKGVLELNTENPKATITFAKLPKYEIPINQINGNENSIEQSKDTQTDSISVKPEYKTNDSAKIQLYNPQNVCVLNNNKLQSPQNNNPNEVWSYSLPKQQTASNPQSLSVVNDYKISNTQNSTPYKMFSYFSPKEEIAVNFPIGYESKLNLPTPNTDSRQLQLNNVNMNPTVTSKLPDYETLNNSGRVQLDNPQNVYALNNNKIRNTLFNTPSEILTSSLPNEQIVVIVPSSYQSQPNVHLLNIDKGVYNGEINPKAAAAFAKLSDFEIPYNGDRIQFNNPQNVYAILNNKIQNTFNNMPSEVLSSSLPNEEIVVNAPFSYQSQPNVPIPNTDQGVLQLNNEDKIPNTDTLIGGLFVTPDYMSNNNDRILLNNPQYAYSVINNKLQSRQDYIPNKMLSYSLPKEQIAINPHISDQSILNLPTPNTNMKVLHLNNDYMNPKATTTFARLPDYEIPSNGDRIQLYNPQSVYAISNDKMQSTPSKVLSYSLPNEQMAAEAPISDQPQLNIPTPNTDKEVQQLNNGDIIPKTTITFAKLPEYVIPNKQIHKKDNLNILSTDTLTGGIFVTPRYKTDNNDRIQLSNPQNVYAVNDNKIQSAQNYLPNEALSYSVPNKQIATEDPICYQPQLSLPTPNTDKGVLELNNGDMNPIATTTFAKLPDYEIVNNQIDEKETLNKQKLDLTGSFLNVDRVFNPQKVETGIYRPMRICSEPNYYTSKLNPSATYTNPEEINRHTLVNMKPEKYFVPNYSNSIDYTSIISGQTNGIVTPKETGDELIMYQEIYTPKELTQYEVPQQVTYKNSGSNNVPKAKYIELNSSLPKYNKLDTNDKLYEAAPEFALNGENNHNLLNPAMYDEKTIKVQESTFIPLGMNADAYVTNEVEENKYLPYIHQKNDLGEDSKYIDIFNKHYTMNVDVINKDKNNNRPEYTILDQAELCNPRINIAVNDNQLFLPSEKISYQDQPSIEPLSPFNISVRGEGNVYNIQDNEYLNLPVAQKLRQVNQYPDNSETNSEIVYDVGLKKSNEACMPLYVGSDLQQYRIVNNINENQNIEIFDIKPAGIINLKGADKGIKGPNSLVTETLNKPAFINYELADTKTNSSPEKYQIKYPELGLQNNAEEKPCKSTVFNMPITEKTINDDFTKSIATPLETSPTDILNIRTDPDKISKQATKYYNENYSPIEQTQNIITGIYKDTESPVYSNLVLDEIQPDLSVVGKGKVEQIKDINNAQIFDNYKMPTPVAHDIHKILIDGYNTSDNTKLHICNPKDEKETPIEGKYESYVIHNTNYKSNYSQPGQPGTEIYSTFRRTDGNIGISNSESNEVLNEVTPLPRSQSTVNYLSTSDQPVKIEAIKCTDVNTLTPQVELNVQQRYMYPQMPTYHQNANSVEEEIQYTATIQGAINDKPDIYPLSYNKPVPVETENNIFQDYDSKINDKSIYMDTVTLSVGAKAKEPNKQENDYDIYTGYLNDIPRINEGISLAYPSLTQPSENNAFNDNMNLNFGYHVTPEEATANEYQVTGQIIDELNVHQLSSLYTINNERPTHWYESIKNKNLNVCQDFSKKYQVYEEKPHDFISLAINSGPGKYNSNNLEPTFLTLNHQPSQSIININPTLEKFTPLNEIKYDESNSYPIPSSSDFKNSLSDNTIPSAAEMLPNSLNSLGIPLQGSNLLPQNQWYYSSSSSRQSLPTFITFKNNLNPCLSQNLNQPPLDSSQIQSTALSVLKNNLLNYLKSNDNIVNTTSINIPLGDLGVAKYEPIDNIQHFTINTENDDINLKAWYSKLKLIKAKITFETTEASALNFIPVVNNKSKYCPVKVQEIAKNAISKVYGDPIVIKGVYSFDEPYVIVDNVDSACIYNGGYIFLWPTFCDCGCQKAGCQCWLQNLNNSC